MISGREKYYRNFFRLLHLEGEQNASSALKQTAKGQALSETFICDRQKQLNQQSQQRT